MADHFAVHHHSSVQLLRFSTVLDRICASLFAFTPQNAISDSHQTVGFSVEFTEAS